MDNVIGGRAGEYFDHAWAQFSTLVRRGDTQTHCYRVAGLSLRIEASNGALAHSISRALSHLETDAADAPDLTLAVWDSQGTGTDSLRPAWTTSDYGDCGLIAGFNDSRFHIAAPYDPVPVLRMLDRETRRAIYWTPDSQKLPEWEFGIPLRTLIHEWMLSNDRFMVHGGAVGHANGGVLLAGAGGQGKSNTALSCLNSDLLYASDDLCVVTDSPDWQVHSLYATGKMVAGDLYRHPHLAAHVSNPDALDREKALFYLHEVFPERIIRSMPLLAVVMPQVIARGASEIVPASRGATQRAIATSTIEMSRWTAAFTFTAAAKLARALPSFTLRIGEDFPNVPTLIGALIDRLCR